MMGDAIFVLVLATTIPCGFFNPAPLDDITINLNLDESPKGQRYGNRGHDWGQETEALNNNRTVRDARVVPGGADYAGDSNPWLNGDYNVLFFHLATYGVAHVDDKSQTFRQLRFLDSEAGAVKPMTWAKGKDDSTVLITLLGKTLPSTISKDKKMITFPFQFLPDAPNGLIFKWISPDEALFIENRKKEPIDAPSFPYPKKPGVKGKFAIITGPPGAGKSTIAGIISKSKSFVFYEGDGFKFGSNPYIFPGESSVDARNSKPYLIGVGMAQRWRALLAYMVNQKQRGLKIITDRAPTDQYYRMIAEDIKKERARVGDDWIVALDIQKRKGRDIFREVLGKDLVFIVLDITLALVKKRLAARGKGEAYLAAEHFKYEPADGTEPNTVSYPILEKKTQQQNAQDVYNWILHQNIKPIKP